MLYSTLQRHGQHCDASTCRSVVMLYTTCHSVAQVDFGLNCTFVSHMSEANLIRKFNGLTVLAVILHGRQVLVHPHVPGYKAYGL